MAKLGQQCRKVAIECTYFMKNTANVERMISKTRETRKKMLAAEEISELVLKDMVQKVYVDEEVCIMSNISRSNKG